MINLFHPTIFKEEWLQELEKTFSTRWIGQGPKVDEFEKKFCEEFTYEYSLGLNSGTAALELAYDLVGIKEGDKVISTVMTCSATHIPLIRRKANLVFADIDINTFNMSYDSLLDKFTDNTKAIVVVNLGGIQCDKRIFDFAKERKIPVIVDACQSLGITELYGDYICYSLQAIKHFTCSDGGVLVTRNKEDHERAKRLRWFGIDREQKINNNWKCLTSKREMCMDMYEAGYKFHMNDVMATMALVGLKHSDKILKKRKKICDKYYNAFKDHVQCVYGGSYWLFAILVNNREEFEYKLLQLGIESDPVHLRNDIFSLFGGKRQNLPNMNLIEYKYTYLPLHYNLSDNDVDYVIENVIKVLNETNNNISIGK